MKFSGVLLHASMVAFTVAASCNRDYCLRAVAASSLPTLSATADCSSFLLKTVTPPVVTVTMSATKVSVVTVVPTNASKRIPTYAAACSGVVRYSSACACIGVTARTTTLPTPTAVVYVSTTTTKTATPATTTAAMNYGCTPLFFPGSEFVMGSSMGNGCGGQTSSCFCVPRKSDSLGTCTEGLNQSCGRKCQTTADCDSGKECLKGLIRCSDVAGQGICIFTRNPVCANTAISSRIFKRGVSGVRPRSIDKAATLSEREVTEIGIMPE